MWLDVRNGPAFDLPACEGPVRTWVIASVPRTGSTLLARTLASCGVGDPKEYLNPMQVRDWEARLAPGRWGRLRHRALVGPLVPLAGLAPWPDARLRAYLDRVIARRSSGGWFGLKIHHHHLQRWFLARDRDPVAWLHAAHWVALTRRDRLAQAISWTRALRTGRWVSAQRAHLPDVYDATAIEGRLRAIEAAEAGWDTFFTSAGITPQRLVYEDLLADREGAARRVLEALGAPPPLRFPPPDLSRQADATSLAWAARFRAERPGRA